MKIYFAGPLFTTGEQSLNAAIVELLRDYGHKVFLPQEDVVQTASAAAIFRALVDGIDRSDAVVANMDGSDPDSGTCWEVGYAYRKKHILLYRTDLRSEAGELGPINLMLHRSASVPILNLGPIPVLEIARVIDLALRHLGEAVEPL